MYKKGSCWDGYVQAGMKKKGNRMVPNCVPAGSKKMAEGGLTKWFKEKWVDIGSKKKGAMMKAKNGKAIMIVIGVGKKKKVQKKMGGGMTAGSQSAMGRLQKANMMSKGGLKTELNNPAKGYTKGGMADYYKDLM